MIKKCLPKYNYPQNRVELEKVEVSEWQAQRSRTLVTLGPEESNLSNLLP